jgi:transposase-like protein
MGKKGYPPEFRKRALDLIKAGRKACDVARDLGISDQTVYNWRRQDRVDRGVEDGVTTAESAKLKAAKKKIAELEAELAIHRRAAELLKERTDPKVGTRPSR